MRYDYDVIVVGGRVAGASTAMLLARRGHRVLVVDRATLPADTVSTHALLRTGVLQLTRWGVLDRIIDVGTPPISKIMLGFGEERIPFQIRDDHGIEQLYAPRRFVLDRVLLDEAISDGADFCGGTNVVGLHRDPGGRASGVIVDRDRVITARYVIGADGIRSRVARLAEAATVKSHAPTNAIQYAYYTGVEAPGYWFQFTPGVNAGIVPTNEGAACVFAGRPRSDTARFRPDPDGEFRRLLAKAGADLAGVVAAGTRMSGFRGTTGLPGFAKQAWGPGWALVGDAGYSKDPVSAHGISAALRDAELCARAVDSALCDPVGEAGAFERYQSVRDDLSEPLFLESMTLARYQWDAAEASARMRRISEGVRNECDTLITLPSWGTAFTRTADNQPRRPDRQSPGPNHRRPAEGAAGAAALAEATAS